MGALLIISLLSLALAIRAGVFGGLSSSADEARAVDAGLFDACARTLVLVLLSLLGLFALSVMYGNALGSGVADLTPAR
jgi:hypothetical protein